VTRYADSCTDFELSLVLNLLNRKLVTILLDKRILTNIMTVKRNFFQYVIKQSVVYYWWISIAFCGCQSNRTFQFICKGAWLRNADLSHPIETLCPNAKRFSDYRKWRLVKQTTLNIVVENELTKAWLASLWPSSCIVTVGHFNTAQMGLWLATNFTYN
jgi:hypothetical protein